MKILKYTGIVLVVLVALFLLLGLLTPSFEYSVRATIHASPQKCWEVLNDTSRMGRWIPGFRSFTLKAGKSMQPGAVYEVIIEQDERYVMTERIKEMNPPTSISFQMTNDVMNSDFEFLFSPTPEGTSITNHYRIEGNNVMWKSILYLSSSYLESGAREQVEKLKVEIESDH